jgi:hypothetical protein
MAVEIDTFIWALSERTEGARLPTAIAPLSIIFTNVAAICSYSGTCDLLRRFDIENGQYSLD